MDIKSRTQLEMRRQLMYVGVPFRIASLVATSIFDRERMVRRSPIPAATEDTAFERVREWIDYVAGTAVRDDVEPLLADLFGPDQNVYEWAAPGIRTDDSQDGLPVNPRKAATSLTKAAIDTAREAIVSDILRADRTEEGIVDDFENSLELLLVGELIPASYLPEGATRDHDRNLQLLVYEQAWTVLERMDVDESAPTKDRYAIAVLFQVLWGLLQSYPPVADVRQPLEAQALIFPANTRCLRCGVKVHHGNGSGELHERYVSGRCLHEYVTDEDRDTIWAQPPSDPEDLANRLLFLANERFGLSVEDLKSDAPLPDRQPEELAAFIESAQGLVGVELDEEDLAMVDSLGDLFNLITKKLEPIPTSPYVGDRVSEIFSGIGIFSSSPVKRSSSGAHHPRATCLGGELLKHVDDPELARGKLARHVNLINQGRCPRCTQELDSSPAGSRATRCRCIPVCSECGTEEAIIGVRFADWPGGGRGFAVNGTDEEEAAAAFNLFPTVDPADVNTEAERPKPWSYRSWPNRILGQLPDDGLRTIQTVGRLQSIDNDVVSIRSRALGCFLGGAVGDALGGPVEFMSLNEIRRLIGARGVQGYWGRSPHKGAFTDDTQMTLFTAEGLIRARQRWHGSDYNWWSPLNVTSRSYQRWLLTQGVDTNSQNPSLDTEFLRTGWLVTVPELWVRMGPGNTCLSALRSGQSGTIEEPINDSKGCGGVMRVAPAGFVPFDDYAFELGSGLAALTHGHPSGYLAAGALTNIISCLTEGSTLDDAVEAALKLLKAETRGRECVIALERAMDLARQRTPSPEAVESLGAGWVAEEALAIAIYCSMVTQDFGSGVLLAVNHSGDSDSTGSIAGQILGTMLGVEAIPQEWLDGLQLGSVVERVAHDFVDVFHEDKVFVNDLYPAW